MAVRAAGAGKAQAMGREFPLQRLPEAVPGAAVRAPALARVPAWAAVAAGAGVPGAAQAVRVLAVARVPAGAPTAAGVPAAPAMVWAAATAAVTGAAAAALAAVAAAGGLRPNGSPDGMVRPIRQPAPAAGTNKASPPSASRTAKNRTSRQACPAHQSDEQSRRPDNGTIRARIGKASGYTHRSFRPADHGLRGQRHPRSLDVKPQRKIEGGFPGGPMRWPRRRECGSSGIRAGCRRGGSRAS